MSQLDFLEQPTPPPQPKSGLLGLSWGSWVLIVGVVSIALVLGIQLTRQNQVQPRIGEVAPDFTITTFDGETLRLSDLRGQAVLVNFWGSWCPPCYQEAPELQQLYEDYQARGFTIVGVNRLDTPTDAATFIQQFDLTFPNGADVQERITELYNLQGTPENFLVDPNGVIAQAWLFGVTYDMVAEELEIILGGNTP
jgi:cytochrome c biogenesis protein CcmG, thiol:disulfide interchange protein DsbE